MTKEDFLKDVSSWCSHRPLLWEALELTIDSNLPVAEFGCGGGSTEFIRQYCADAGRQFFSYDNNKEWADKYGSTFIEDWNKADIYKEYSVVLIDHAPGEHRHEAVAILKDLARIIVIHDSEVGGSGNYLYEKIYPLFKYRKDYNVTEGGAGATMLSNNIDFNQQKDAEITDSVDNQMFHTLKSEEIKCKNGHSVGGIIPDVLDVEYDGKVCDCGKIAFYKEMCGCPSGRHYEIKTKENV